MMLLLTTGGVTSVLMAALTMAVGITVLLAPSYMATSLPAGDT